MRFGKLDIDPAKNPAVLDTATWDRGAAWAAVQAVDDTYWPALMEAAASDSPLPAISGVTPYAASCARHEGTLYCLAELADGQQVFVALGPQADDSALRPAIGIRSLPSLTPNTQSPIPSLRVYPTDAAIIDRFFRLIAPAKGPRALGSVPRLGIGTRMTTAVWPAIWQAMVQAGFAANAIQNSVRELNFMSTLLEGRPAEKNIAFGFGTIETGYTGSSFEGLWVSGVLDALKHGRSSTALPSAQDARRYGADADHIQVKRGADGLDRAKRMLDATRYYSFYTLDVSDVLDYAALSVGAAGTAYLESRISDGIQRSDLLSYHRQPRRIGGIDYRPDDVTLGRLVGKYWVALDAVSDLYEHLCGLKARPEQRRRNGAAFDLELSIDEHPNDIPTFECLTSEEELIFVLLEAQRRSIPLTHVAPNFGVEKGVDYRGADGLAGFEARARALCRITEEFGVMADFHSGDDLSAESRRAIGRATGGRNHFKVSPYLQLLFADVLAEYHPDLFRRWRQDAWDYAAREAAANSTFAAECMRKDLTPSAPSFDELRACPERSEGTGSSLRGKGDGGIGEVFHHFGFAFVGRRDLAGQFICREEFYSLSPAFYRAHQERIVAYLTELAEDLRLGR